MTIYAFSIENFKRSKYEVDALMDMAKVKLIQLSQHGDLLDRYGASIRILGQRELVKPDVLAAIDRAVEMTSRNGDAVLNVCIPYTSREEMATAIKETVREYASPSGQVMSRNSPLEGVRERHPHSKPLAGDREHSPASAPLSYSSSDAESSSSSSTTLHPESPPTEIASETSDNTVPPLHAKLSPLKGYPDPETITSETLTDHMFTAGCPPLDLLVRTSGVERLSDFMLWQCHQDTEIAFLDILWPGFDLWTFLPVLVEWQWNERRRLNAGSERRRQAARESSKERTDGALKVP